LYFEIRIIHSANKNNMAVYVDKDRFNTFYSEHGIDFQREIIDMYFKEGSYHLFNKLEEVIDEKDFTAVALYSSSLNGTISCFCVNFVEPAMRAREIEFLAMDIINSTDSNIEPRVVMLKSIFNKLKSEFEIFNDEMIGLQRDKAEEKEE